MGRKLGHLEAWESNNPAYIRYQLHNNEQGTRFIKISNLPPEFAGTTFGLKDPGMGWENYRRISLLKALLVMGLVSFFTSCTVCSREPSLNNHLLDLQRILSFDPNNVCDMDYSDDLPSHRIGQAGVVPYLYCDILIRPGLTPNVERATIYHEIAHCLGVDHYYGPDFNIMSPKAQDENYYQQNWDRLEQEFIDYVCIKTSCKADRDSRLGYPR